MQQSKDKAGHCYAKQCRVGLSTARAKPRPPRRLDSSGGGARARGYPGAPGLIRGLMIVDNL